MVFSRFRQKNILENRIRGQHLCVGCGLCSLVCPSQAIQIVYGRYKEFRPLIEERKCDGCGLCNKYCPVIRENLEGIAKKITSSSDGMMFGLDSSQSFVGFDKNQEGRKGSASGGVVTGVLQHLLINGDIEEVIHAEAVNAVTGAVHYKVCVSKSITECHQRRSSFYGPLCYYDAMSQYKDKAAKIAITGVPCVLRGLKKLFTKHPRFNKNKVTLLALSCSHNVSGQFVDHLADSFNIDPSQPYIALLRDKQNISDANNFNTCFKYDNHVPDRRNRYSTLFTPLWRSYCFSLEACHYCPDFWGAEADVSVKDAWGHWAEDPLGKSIVVVRNQKLLETIQAIDCLELEALPLSVARDCQRETVIYKQVSIRDRFEKSWLSKDNRTNGFAFYFPASRISKTLYHLLGYRLSNVILLAFIKLWPFAGNQDHTKDYLLFHRLRRSLAHLIPTDRQLVVFGTGKMAFDIAKTFSAEVCFFVDNDSSKHGTFFVGKPVLDPKVLAEKKRCHFVLIASMYHDEIANQLTGYGRIEGRDFSKCYSAYAKAGGIPKKPLKSLFFRRKRCKRPQQKKILILGGYGFQNTGDEAQLNTNLSELTSKFPSHIIKVLTPNPRYTYFEHDRCLIGDAPRVSFYDFGTKPLYNLSTQPQKIQFLLQSLLIYFNAHLVARDLPTFFLSAKRSALLYELSTADLVFFSGGGYLTGSTLSRLWDGIFFTIYADVMKVPVVMSGQTIGVWDSVFTKYLARLGLSKAKAITTRDADKSLLALSELGISHDRIFSTFDDALYCQKELSNQIMNNVFEASGLDASSDYFALNIHYWGLKTPEEKECLIKRIGNSLEVIQKETGLLILGVPMIPEDNHALSVLKKVFADLNMRILNYNYDFKIARTAISNSKFCLTMKHHPIIFSLGEKVPVISISYGSYYEQKNLGALKLFSLERFNVKFEDDDFQGKLIDMINNVSSDKEIIIKNIEDSLLTLKVRKNKLMNIIVEHLEAAS